MLHCFFLFNFLFFNKRGVTKVCYSLDFFILNVGAK